MIALLFALGTFAAWLVLSGIALLVYRVGYRMKHGVWL